MKRINNLYSEIISLENLRLADKVARKGKKGNTSVQQHIRNADANLIKSYLQEILKLKIRDNYQVFPVKSRGIDFLGYVFFHSHIKIRKSIKQRFAKMLFTSINEASLAAYNGWLKSYLQEILKLKIRENYSIT